MIAAQTGIAGSTTLGNNVHIGGQVGIAQHLQIGDNVRIAAKSGVMNNLEANATYGTWNASGCISKAVPSSSRLTFHYILSMRCRRNPCRANYGVSPSDGVLEAIREEAKHEPQGRRIDDRVSALSPLHQRWYNANIQYKTGSTTLASVP